MDGALFSGRSVGRGDMSPGGEARMSGKTPPSPKKKRPNASAAEAAPPRAAQARVDQYIAGRLKSIYDEAVAEPIPDRLLELIDRLDRDRKS
jgi:hypothetical protein